MIMNDIMTDIDHCIVDNYIIMTILVPVSTYFPHLPTYRPCHPDSQPYSVEMARDSAASTWGRFAKHDHSYTSKHVLLIVFTITNQICEQVGGLEHEFYDFPYIGNKHPN